MRPFADIAIRQKLTLISLFAVVVALLLTGSALVVYEFQTARESSLTRLTTLAHIIGGTSHATLRFRDALTAMKTLSVLAAEDEIVMACFYDEDGQYLIGYSHTVASCHSQVPKGESESSLSEIVYVH